MLVDDTDVIRAASPWRDEQGRPNVGRRLPDRDWLQRVLRREKEIALPVSASRVPGGLPTITIATPMTSASGHVVGVLVGAVDLSDVRRSVKEIDLTERDRLVVVDAEGRVIAHASSEWEQKSQDLSGEAVLTQARAFVPAWRRCASR